jgi:hypothetical protein
MMVRTCGLVTVGFAASSAGDCVYDDCVCDDGLIDCCVGSFLL